MVIMKPDYHLHNTLLSLTCRAFVAFRKRQGRSSEHVMRLAWRKSGICDRFPHPWNYGLLVDLSTVWHGFVEKDDNTITASLMLFVLQMSCLTTFYIQEMLVLLRELQRINKSHFPVKFGQVNETKKRKKKTFEATTTIIIWPGHLPNCVVLALTSQQFPQISRFMSHIGVTSITAIASCTIIPQR